MYTDAIDPALLAAIRHATHKECKDVRGDIKTLTKTLDRLDRFDKHVKEITMLKSSVETVEMGIQHA